MESKTPHKITSKTINNIHVLLFCCGNKRAIDLNKPFIGKEVILWLTGIKQRDDAGMLAETKKYLNEIGEYIYFKDIMPVSAWQWDMYMYSVKHKVAPDYRYIHALNQFNEMIGGDERVDEAIGICNKHTPYNPITPSDDWKNKYIWRAISNSYMYNYNNKNEWSVTSKVDNTSINIEYWIRKERFIDYGYDDEDGYWSGANPDDADNIDLAGNAANDDNDGE